MVRERANMLSRHSQLANVSLADIGERIMPSSYPESTVLGLRWHHLDLNLQFPNNRVNTVFLTEVYQKQSYGIFLYAGIRLRDTFVLHNGLHTRLGNCSTIPCHVLVGILATLHVWPRPIIVYVLARGEQVMNLFITTEGTYARTM